MVFNTFEEERRRRRKAKILHNIRKPPRPLTKPPRPQPTTLEFSTRIPYKPDGTIWTGGLIPGFSRDVKSGKQKRKIGNRR